MVAKETSFVVGDVHRSADAIAMDHYQHSSRRLGFWFLNFVKQARRLSAPESRQVADVILIEHPRTLLCSEIVNDKTRVIRAYRKVTFEIILYQFSIVWFRHRDCEQNDALPAYAVFILNKTLQTLKAGV